MQKQPLWFWNERVQEELLTAKHRRLLKRWDVMMAKGSGPMAEAWLRSLYYSLGPDMYYEIRSGYGQ